MRYFVTFGLMATMLVSIVHVQSAESQMMCAGGDETFHFTISDIVFIGIVTSINPSDSHRLWNYISFDIQYSFKGLTNQSEIVVPTHQGSTYGFEPEIGSMYLIHASNAYGIDLFTSLCSDNKLLETQQDVEEMKNKLLEISIPPPLKQKQFGLAPHAIKCKENLVLIQKYDGSPACVTEQTKQKLVERGWIHSCPNGMLNKQRSLCIAGSPGISGGSESESELQIISKNEILSKGIGFDLPEDTFTQEDLKNLEQKERELNKIANDPDTAEEKRRQIHLEIQEMQVRLQYPFQTGVPYHLVLFMQEKYQIFQEHRSELKGEISVTYSSPTDISHVHHALRIGIHPDSFTLSELEHQDKKIREFLGNEMNILYEPALIIPAGK